MINWLKCYTIQCEDKKCLSKDKLMETKITTPYTYARETNKTIVCTELSKSVLQDLPKLCEKCLLLLESKVRQDLCSDAVYPFTVMNPK